MKPKYRNILFDLLTLPTAPFCEEHVAAYIRGWAKSQKALRVREDAVGNILVHLRRGRGRPNPLVLVAHMDHPGFEAERMIAPRKLQAAWRGGVDANYFVGTGVRFYSEGRWVRGKIRSIRQGMVVGRRRVKSVVVDVKGEVAPRSLGMWDFPDPQLRGSRVYTRGCDDVGGVAGIVCALDDLAASREQTDVYSLFTRAEEVGFAGAMAACRSGILPRGARVISIETSSEVPGVSMGNGPILRVGDLRTIFSPRLTAFCRATAQKLADTDRKFRFQRKLMDAGTCEATPFNAHGCESAGICVALGNYHNMDRRRKRIAPEYIDVRDFEAMIRWFVALATTAARPDAGDPAIVKTLAALERYWTPLLKRTAGRVRGVASVRPRP